MAFLEGVERRTTGRSSSEKVGDLLRRLVGPHTVLAWIAFAGIGSVMGIFLLRVLSLSAPWPSLLVLAALAPFVALIVGEVRRPLLAAVVLDIPFQWGIHLNYDDIAGSKGAIGGLGISITTGALVVLYCLWGAEVLANRKAQFRPWTRTALPLLIYVGIATLSMLVAQDIGFAFNEVFILIQTLLLYIFIVSSFRTREDVQFVAAMFAVALALESLVILATQVIGPGFQLPGINTSAASAGAALGAPAPSGPARAVGTLHSPNVASGYLSLFLVPALALFYDRTGTWRRALGLVAFGLGALALLFTFSRGGWLGFGISMAVFATVAIKKRWMSPAVIPVVLGLVAILVVVFLDPITQRLADQAAAEGRVPLIVLALEMIRDHPLLGVGADNFYTALPPYLTPDFYGAWIYVVHNKYLLVWAETGIFALLAFLTFLVAAVRSGFQATGQKDRSLSVLALGLTAGVMGQMVHMGFDIFNGQPQVQGLWMVAALLAVLNHLRTEAKDLG